MLARSSSYGEIHGDSMNGYSRGAIPLYRRAAPSTTTQSPPPSSYELGVEKGGSRPDKRPWFVIEQARCEEAFTQLPIPAIEPFTEGVAEWDDDEPSPSPLVRFAEWPRGKDRRRRFNPRRMESDDEDATPPEVGPAANPLEAAEEKLVSPRREAAPRRPPVSSTERREPERGTREDQSRGSVFSRLGEEAPRRQQTSDGYPDLRNFPSRGALFGHLRPVPVDRAVDPDGDRCFNCWARGHTRFICREPRRLFCFNCGRRNVTMRNCPGARTNT